MSDYIFALIVKPIFIIVKVILSIINLLKVKGSSILYSLFLINFFLPYFLFSDEQIEFLNKLKVDVEKLDSYSFEIISETPLKRGKLAERYKFYYLQPGYEMLKGVFGYCTGTILIKNPNKSEILVKKGKYKQKISKDDERIKDFFETNLKNYIKKLLDLAETARISVEKRSKAEEVSDDDNANETYYVLNVYPPSNLEEITRYKITFKNYKYKDLILSLPYKEEVYGYQKRGGFLSLFIAPSKAKKEILYSLKKWTNYNLEELLTPKSFSFN